MTKKPPLGLIRCGEHPASVYVHPGKNFMTRRTHLARVFICCLTVATRVVGVVVVVVVVVEGTRARASVLVMSGTIKAEADEVRSTCSSLLDTCSAPVFPHCICSIPRRRRPWWRRWWLRRRRLSRRVSWRQRRSYVGNARQTLDPNSSNSCCSQLASLFSQWLWWRWLWWST
jgi:hypothetical protein